MKARLNFVVILRWILGLIFIISGTEKLLSPMENFLYAIQSYEIIPLQELAELIAAVFPWIELFIGVFLILGLWIRWALLGTGAMACGFIVIVGQGMIRQLPLVDCGCFGDLFHFPLWVTFALDWMILLTAYGLLRTLSRTKALSLDSWLD